MNTYIQTYRHIIFLDESNVLDVSSPQPEEVLDFGELNCDQCGKVNADSWEL